MATVMPKSRAGQDVAVRTAVFVGGETKPQGAELPFDGLSDVLSAEP